MGKLLAPFFEALKPAFDDKVDEIKIEQMESSINITYSGKSLSVPLSPQLGYPAIAFLRIRVLCGKSGMNLNPNEPNQTGTFRVRYNEELVPVEVASKSNFEGNREILMFRPVWDKAESQRIA